jgi:arylsulfatase A-like enzyme
MDRLAAGGLRYRDFHTTAICSPTRACLLTGRNHHSNGVGIIQEMSTGFPGYNGMVPRENGFLSEILLAQGYATFAIGKPGAINAALFAASILAGTDPALAERLRAFRHKQTASVLAAQLP